MNQKRFEHVWKKPNNVDGEASESYIERFKARPPYF